MRFFISCQPRLSRFFCSHCTLKIASNPSSENHGPDISEANSWGSIVIILINSAIDDQCVYRRSSPGWYEKKSPDNDLPWNLVAFSKLTVSGFNLRPYAFPLKPFLLLYPNLCEKASHNVARHFRGHRGHLHGTLVTKWHWGQQWISSPELVLGSWSSVNGITMNNQKKNGIDHQCSETHQMGWTWNDQRWSHQCSKFVES